MSTATASPVKLWTVDEYAKRPDPGYPEELVRGRIVAMPVPKRRHGQLCAQIVFLLRQFLSNVDMGHVLCNDSGVITERDPDSVRGPDVAFYSYDRLPKGPLPPTYGPEVPELIFEVLSPDDRWPKVLGKISEYLTAGVEVVVVVDDERKQVRVFDALDTRTLGHEETLSALAMLPGFEATVRELLG